MPGKAPKKKKAKAKPKPKVVAKKKPRAKKLVTKKRKAAPARVAKTTAKKTPTPKTRATPKKKKVAPPPAPSERALAASAQLPEERALSDDEREAIAKVAGTARKFLDAVGGPDAVVHRIAAFVDEVRNGIRQEPKSQDVRLGLGALWGEQVRAQLGWTWVHLTYDDGFASYAVVPDDRAFACFPLNRMQELMKPDARLNTSVAIFNSLVAGTVPGRRKAAYLVIG